ncbi:MAG: SLBB domain-containing protein [Candidatus Latescibacterota bacterium]|jgi:protein involved in polysaccharide export with SLBB domain
MKRYMIYGALFMLLTVVHIVAQTGDKTVIELKQAEPEKKSESAPALIGMEAFREVLESGKYMVGPGDEFLVYVPGMESPFYAEVLAEGGVFIPKVGTIKVAGLSLAEARLRVQQRFAEILRVGQLTFELNKARLFPVPVLGLVEEPGLKAASGVERVSQVLERAGGLTALSSSRSIRLLKTAALSPQQRAAVSLYVSLGKSPTDMGRFVVERVDLDLYWATGESNYNPFVEDGDIVMVSALAGRIASFGALKRPGFYEFVDGDKLSDLLRLSLGPTVDMDDKKIWLFRFEDDMTTRVAMPVDLRAVLAGDAAADFSLHVDDWLVARSIPGYHQDREVRVVGEVSYPGHYVVGPEGMKLRDLVENAGGFTERAFLAEARVVREVARGGEEAEEKDREYERIRFIPVSERTEDENQYFIMKSRERTGQMSVDLVRLFEEDDQAQNIPLLPGDVLVVPTLQRTVAVSGAVTLPGSVTFDSAYSVWDYIERAGGYGWRASKDVRVIKGRTGEIKRASGTVLIQPGDRIWVKEKPERNYWAIFTQGMSVVGQVSTVVLLYVTITQK